MPGVLADHTRVARLQDSGVGSMRHGLAVVILLACGCAKDPGCGEPRAVSRMEQNGSVAFLGKEVLVQLSAQQGRDLVDQVDEVEASDTGCWFELKQSGQLRLHDPKTGRDVMFKKADKGWRYSEVQYPMAM